MITKENITSLCSTFFNERKDLFLVDLKVSPANAILLKIDGDKGVVIDDCIALSRHIEGSLDREKEDFSLEVASAGADAPLKFPRQYKKNIGRQMQIKFHDEKTVKGEIENADDENVMLLITEKEKGKRIKKSYSFPYQQIKESKIIISFK